MLPIMMRVELTFFEEAHDLLGFTRANHRTQTHSRGIALRYHHLQTTRNYAQHVILFSPAVQHSVTNLLDQPNTVVRIDNFVAYLIVHDAFSPGTQFQFHVTCSSFCPSCPSICGRWTCLRSPLGPARLPAYALA